MVGTPAKAGPVELQLGEQHLELAGRVGAVQVHHKQEAGAALGVAQERVAQAAVLVRPLHQARQPVLTCQLEVVVVAEHADVWPQGGEGVRGHLGPRPGDGSQQRGLARIRKAHLQRTQAQFSRMCHVLHLEVVDELLPQGPLLADAWVTVGVAQEVVVSPAAGTSPCRQEPGSGNVQLGKLPALLVSHQGAQGNLCYLDDRVLPAAAVHVLAKSPHATVPEDRGRHVSQRHHGLRTLKDDVSAVAAVASVRPPVGIAEEVGKRDAAVAPGTADNLDTLPVHKRGGRAYAVVLGLGFGVPQRQCRAAQAHRNAFHRGREAHKQSRRNHCFGRFKGSTFPWPVCQSHLPATNPTHLGHHCRWAGDCRFTRDMRQRCQKSRVSTVAGKQKSTGAMGAA
ncbi:unnamed protein product, partial [Ixodes pacificus]